jgi:hypothetical protein
VIKMAVKKTVAASAGATTNPSTASIGGELETPESITASLLEAADKAASDAAVAKINALAKARAVKAANAAARKAASDNINSIQAALAAEKANDHLSFGNIQEVARVAPTAEEYVRVEIPSSDLFDHTHPGVQLNRHKFEPGKTYLLRGDVALEVKRRLAMFHDEQVRLLRPNADRKALNDVNRGSQWTSRGGNAVVPLGRLEDVPVASDERIYTVDF